MSNTTSATDRGKAIGPIELTMDHDRHILIVMLGPAALLTVGFFDDRVAIALFLAAAFVAHAPAISRVQGDSR